VNRTAPQDETLTLDGIRKAHWRAWAILAALLVLAVSVRLYGLGSRSLWADEFCTWHVSRMPLGESFRWGPELTKPPLYQLTLRTITSDPHPPEWVLRLPAAIAGILAIPAAFWLGTLAGGARVGCALAGLLAMQPFHIHHSQEARPYSMLVLGCILSTGLWYRLVASRRSVDWVLYVVVATLTFYAHYLVVLTLAAHVIWLAFVSVKGDRCFPRIPSFALLAVGVLCVPMVWHYYIYRQMTFQGLDWIRPPTWASAFAVLGKLSFGYAWVFAVLAPALTVWAVVGARQTRARQSSDEPTEEGGSATMHAQLIACHSALAKAGEEPGPFAAFRVTSWDRRNLCGLLAAWLFCSWFGLLVISWIRHPAMVDRYAIPAIIPALLLPLLVSERLFQKGPLVLMAAFMAYGGVQRLDQSSTVALGFRELVEFLGERVDPAKDAVVLTIDDMADLHWDDAERLGFAYYPLPTSMPYSELHVAPDGITVENPEVLKDPRAFWLMVLHTAPFPILERAGRKALQIQVENRWFSQLLFEPYRLLKIAPLDTTP